ncbi:MAG: hypothetical protein Q9187_002987 [Circinaria calcarea]
MSKTDDTSYDVRLTSSLSRVVYNSHGARPSLRMSSASNNQGTEVGGVPGDEGYAAALGENAALGGIWQPSQGIKFHSPSGQPAQRTWRSDYGIVFSSSKHTQQSITNAPGVSSYQRSHFTSAPKLNGPRLGCMPKKAPRSLLHAHEGNIFGKSFYKDEEEDAGVPKRTLPLTPQVGKPTSVPRVSGGQSQGSVKAPTSGQVRKQSKSTNEPNLTTDRSAKALIGKSLTPAERDVLKAGTAVKKGDILDKRAGQAEDNAAQATNTKSSQALLPTSSGAIESAVALQSVQEVPTAKPSREAESILKTQNTAQLSSDCVKTSSTGKAIVPVQFKHPYSALEKVQSYCGGKPTGWVTARKRPLSKTSSISNHGDYTKQFRVVSPPWEVINSTQSSSSNATKTEMHFSRETYQLLGPKGTSENILPDAVTMAKRLTDVPTSQMGPKVHADKISSGQNLYKPFTLQNPNPYSFPNLGLLSEEGDKICHHEQVDSRPLRMKATDQPSLLEVSDPRTDSLESIDESDDPQDSSWEKYYGLAEVKDCPSEGFGFPQAESQKLYSEDDHLFSDTLFSVNGIGSGSASRKPYEQTILGYGGLMAALMIVEKMAKSSILRCRLRIMRDEVRLFRNELRVSMDLYRHFRRFGVEFDRYSTLNLESQQLLLYLVNKARVSAPFDDYGAADQELSLRFYDLKRNCVSNSGSHWKEIRTIWAKISRRNDTNRPGSYFFNMSEMARDVWQVCDKGYGTLSREHFDNASDFSSRITERVKHIQYLSSGAIDYWHGLRWMSDKNYRAFQKCKGMLKALRLQISSMQPCLYAYQSITLRRSMEMASNAATPDLVDEHDNISRSAEAVIHKGLSSEARRGVQKVSIRKVAKGLSNIYQSPKGVTKGGDGVWYRRPLLQPTQIRKYHSIQTGAHSGEKLSSTLDPDDSPTAEGEDVIAGVPSFTTDESDKADGALSTDHVYLKYQIPESRLREAMLASRSTGAAYWQYSLHENATGRKPRVHYCKTIEATERIAQLFLNEEVLGFDIEWKPGANPSDGIKNNVSLVQLASEERIALFHIARFGKDGIENLVSPTLRQIMEDPNITKAGVSVKADCTRLRKFMAIQPRGLFELSHLYKLVRYSDGNIKKIDKRLVALAQQVEEHLQLPMWKGEVRSSDWTQDLSYQQIQYAASDSYAGLQLYDVMEGKRKALVPTPPRPEHAELNIPIRLANGRTVSTYDELEEFTNENPIKDDRSQPIDIEEMARDFLNIAIEDSEGTQPPAKLSKAAKSKSCLDKPPEIIAAEGWIQQWRVTLPSDYKVKATPAYLRAYFLWHHSDKEVLEAASILRDPPLQASTVSNYILEAIRIERLPFNSYRLPEVLAHLPTGLADGKYQSLRKLVN